MPAVILAARDTLWAWAAGGATAVGVIARHTLAAGFNSGDVLRDSLGNSFAGATAAAVACAVLIAGFTAAALLYRPPASQAARSTDDA